MQRASLLVLCGLFQLGNSVNRFVHFFPDPIDIVRIASWVYVYRPFQACKEALSRLIFSERVCPMLFRFEDKSKFKTTYWIFGVFFKGVE